MLKLSLAYSNFCLYYFQWKATHTPPALHSLCTCLLGMPLVRGEAGTHVTLEAMLLEYNWR